MTINILEEDGGPAMNKVTSAIAAAHVLPRDAAHWSRIQVPDTTVRWNRYGCGFSS